MTSGSQKFYCREDGQLVDGLHDCGFALCSYSVESFQKRGWMDQAERLTEKYFVENPRSRPVRGSDGVTRAELIPFTPEEIEAVGKHSKGSRSSVTAKVVMGALLGAGFGCALGFFVPPEPHPVGLVSAGVVGAIIGATGIGLIAIGR